MAPVRNGRVLFKEIPTGYPEPGKTTVYDATQTIDLDTVTLPQNGVLVKTLALSIDPYLRGKMLVKDSPYPDPYVIGETINGWGIGVIIRSEHPAFNPGDHVSSWNLNFEEYTIRIGATSGPNMLLIIKNNEGLPWSVYVGAAGMPGKTAWYGWQEFAKAKKGDIVFVTSGAGPVGSMVIQLAKREGLKVIASAGSDEKVGFMTDIGADVAFNYKATSTKEILKREGPINLYWDNVGGESLDLVLENAADWARFIECGMISGYNSADGPGIKNLFQVVTRRLSLHGFVITDWEEKHGKSFYETIPGLLASGKLKYKEDRTFGLEGAGQALRDVQIGRNSGKSVVIVAED